MASHYTESKSYLALQPPNRQGWLLIILKVSAQMPQTQRGLPRPLTTDAQALVYSIRLPGSSQPLPPSETDSLIYCLSSPKRMYGPPKLLFGSLPYFQLPAHNIY